MKDILRSGKDQLFKARRIAIPSVMAAAISCGTGISGPQGIRPEVTPMVRDVTPPTMVEMTGPPDGSTVNFDSFCFPMRAKDDRSKYPTLYHRQSFDSKEWSEWQNTFVACYTVNNGVHTFEVQLKDAAGNISPIIKRTFTVNAP